MSDTGGQKLFLYLIGGFTLLVLVFIFMFSKNERSNSAAVQVAGYSQTDSNRPVALASETFYDLGKIKVSEEKSGRFTLENSGSSPLQLFDITSSCGCTVGKITIDGVLSPEFGMHSKSKWVGEVKPGSKAEIEVIYRPYVMPVKGVVTRDVFVTTNDPANKMITYTVKADVQ